MAELTTAQFYDLLARGSSAKLVRAVRNGQPLHPVLPPNLGAGRTFGARLSPLAMAWHWPWERRPARCLEALEALLEAGADPNLGDGLGRRPLALLAWLAHDGLPEAAVTRMVRGGADPFALSKHKPNTVQACALEL